MEPYKLGEMEQALADLIWEQAPLRSRTLTQLCEEKFNWKRTTTYTMLKRLCDRGLFQNQQGTIVSLITKEEFRAKQGEAFLNTAFAGSLPKFIATFIKNKKISEKEMKEILQLINEHKEE